MLALYHFGPIANSLTPLLCLIEKGLEFDDRFLSSRRWEHHAPAFLAINPEGKVPVLIHEGHVVTESTVINEYLEDVFPEAPLRPADAWGRAQVRVWTKFVDEYLCPALTVIGANNASSFASSIDKAEMQTILQRMPDPEIRKKWRIVSSGGFTPEQLEDARTRLGRAVAQMETQLAANGDWFVGDAYSLADIKIFSMTPGVERVAPDLCNETVSPHVHAWLRRVEARPAVKAMFARVYQR